MAVSSCLRCAHTSFEKAESAISGLRFTRDFVQCAKCGGVIGVIESDDLNARLDAIENRLKNVSGPSKFDAEPSGQATGRAARRSSRGQPDSR